MYIWEHKNDCWSIDKEFCQRYNIKIPFFYKQKERKNKIKRIFNEK